MASAENTPGSKEKSRTTSASRKWLFRIGMLILSWMIIELTCYVMVTNASALGLEELLRAQTYLRDGGTARRSVSETFHPYVGWTHNPDIFSQDVDCCGHKLMTNRFGFFDSGDGIYQRNDKQLIVAICGGSVAWQMSCAAEQHLKEQLRTIPEYRDREVVLVRLAQSGYKQPQALFALNYYLLMGAEFDLVINLDGYNEIALAVAENFVSHTALEYPQGWYVRSRELVDPRDSDDSLRVFEIRGRRQRSASRALTSPLRVLPSYQFWWYFKDERWRVELNEIEEELLTARRSRHGGFIHTGPLPTAKSERDAMLEAVRIWKQSSLQIHRLCQSHGIRYSHALQPNQYDPGSKKFSEYELENCYSETVAYAKYIQEGYPLLRQAGMELRDTGVDFMDLTRLFENVEETLYVDPYCHFNTRGSELIAREIGSRIRAVTVPPNPKIGQ